MRDALLRIGESVALDCEDVTIEIDGSGRLVLHRSKTDQEGKGVSLFLTARTIDAIRQLREGAGKGAAARLLEVD